MRLVVSIIVLLFAACGKTPITSLDAYDVCKGYAQMKPPSVVERLAYGAMSLGTTELIIAMNNESMKEYDDELQRRGITDCSAKGLAKFECEKVLQNTSSDAYSACVLTNTNSFAARIASDNAAAAAIAATAAAASATRSTQQQQWQNQLNTLQNQRLY